MLFNELKDLKPQVWVINVVALINGLVGPFVAIAIITGYLFFVYFVFSSNHIDLNNATVSGLVFSVISGIGAVAGLIAGYYFGKKDQKPESDENNKLATSTSE